MIDIMVTQTVRHACDRCGLAQKNWYAKAVDATTPARQEGFVISYYSFEGCPRYTCFCKACAEETANADSR